MVCSCVIENDAVSGGKVGTDGNKFLHLVHLLPVKADRTTNHKHTAASCIDSFISLSDSWGPLIHCRVKSPTKPVKHLVKSANADAACISFCYGFLLNKHNRGLRKVHYLWCEWSIQGFKDLHIQGTIVITTDITSKGSMVTSKTQIPSHNQEIISWIKSTAGHVTIDSRAQWKCPRPWTRY